MKLSDRLLTEDEVALILDALESYQQIIDNNADVSQSERDQIDALMTSIERKIYS